MSARPVRSIAWGRIIYFVVACFVSIAISYLFGDRLTNGADQIGIIATVFSILSGVLIAVVSILGDPSMLMDQSWRHNYLRTIEIQRKLHRNTDVFLLYILLLSSLFAFSIVDPKDQIYWNMQRVVLFLTTLSFIVSFTLPQTLKNIQKQRLDSAIASMKPPRTG